ncbi:hypothetical protein AGIG_G11031 [Arapaima gigas]
MLGVTEPWRTRLLGHGAAPTGRLPVGVHGGSQRPPHMNGQRAGDDRRGTRGHFCVGRTARGGHTGVTRDRRRGDGDGADARRDSSRRSSAVPAGSRCPC